MWFKTTPAGQVVNPVSWFAGLDLGQASDFTALAILQRTNQVKAAPLLELQFLRRWELGTSYPQIVADVLDIINKPAKSSRTQRPLRGCTFGLDATGVGRAIVDMFQQARPPCRLRPITITGGNTVSFDSGTTRVPKADLVAVVNAAMQTKRLAWDRRLPFDEVLAKELATFETRLTATGNEQFGTWREGQHDDLVLAVAIAVWLADKAQPAPGSKPFAVGGMKSIDVLNHGQGGFQL